MAPNDAPAAAVIAPLSRRPIAGRRERRLTSTDLASKIAIGVVAGLLGETRSSAMSRGLVLGARFRLVNRIGVGALGELWRGVDWPRARGVDRVPAKPIAIRRMPRSDAPSTLDMFLAESRLAMKIRHPSHVKVHAVGENDGIAWIATELLLAESLESLLERRGTLAPGAALLLIAALAEVVAEAHSIGLAHGAIDANAVFLHREEDGSMTAKLSDFGRARLFGAARVTRESDVHALGMLLMRCVSGADGQAVCRIVAQCVEAPRITAATLAQNARLASWSARGGWSDLQRMVRIPEAFLEAESFGEIGHLDSLPTEPDEFVVEAVASVVPELVAAPSVAPPSVATFISLPRVLSSPDMASPSQPVKSEPPVAISIPEPRAAVPSMVDFRSGASPWRKWAMASALVASIAFVGMSAMRTPSHVQVAHAAAPRAVETEAPKPVIVETKQAPIAAPPITPTPQPAPTATQPPAQPAQPAQPVAAQPAKPSAPYKAAPPSEPVGLHPAIAGVPLWDPPAAKVAKPKDDNPYE